MDVKKFHRVAGIVLTVSAVLITIGMWFFAITDALIYPLALTIPGCEAFMPLVVTPFVSLGIIIGALLVLLSRYKIAGYILFAFSLLILPKLIPLALPQADDAVCQFFSEAFEKGVKQE